MLILDRQRRKITHTGQAQNRQVLIYMPRAYCHFFKMIAKRPEPVDFFESHLSNMLSQV